MSSKEFVSKFEAFLKEKLPVIESFHPHFSHAFGEMLDVGGKRFRPLLLLSVVHCSRPLLVENALHVALGLEMMHTYSLIHDDHSFTYSFMIIIHLHSNSLRRAAPLFASNL